MCEDVARTVHLARAYGELTPLPADQVDALHARYKNLYGQRSAAAGAEQEVRA